MTIIYILYYILAYIQHNADVSLEKKSVSCSIENHLSVLWMFGTAPRSVSSVEAKPQTARRQLASPVVV